MNELDLFAAAVAVADPQERVALLEQHCAGQPELRQRLEQLLDAHFQSNPLLDQPQPVPTGAYGGPEAVSAGSPSVGGAAGTVIAGKYTLVELIGEGGMGAVWRAKQSEPVKRFGAVKLIKAGMDSKQVLARFEAERQALALMDHPNIAKVLDGGLHEQRPFFVMELVKGVPITDYCDRCKLTPKERLQLFVPVCQAIQHAHQKGIIHRDVKPSNVLVALYDDRPVPKVIDFGVAKATGGTLTEHTIDTGLGAVVGTPEYMSPEQATFNNLDIDTRSDVYALGVLLYELLTGSPPFSKKELEQKGLLEILRVVREEEPPRPSAKLSTADALPTLSANRGTEPRKLTDLLRYELDWIVMKALEKDRTRRYETASGFAAVVQRYLASEPVQAHPPSTAYRLSKFLRRRRGPVLAGTLVLLALVGGIVGTTFGMLRAEQRQIEAEQARGREAQRADGERQAKEQEALQRARAERARDRTWQALDAMTSAATGDSLTTQTVVSEEQKKFLREVLTYYQEFASDKADDEQSRARTAAAAYRVGLIESRLGRQGESADALGLARERYAKLAADYASVREYRQGLADCHNCLGNRLSDLEKAAEAGEEYRQALAIQEKLVADFADVRGCWRRLALIHNNLGNLLRDLGKHPQAEEHYQKAMPIQEKLTAEFQTVPKYSHELAITCYNLGLVLEARGDRVRAKAQCDKALAIWDKLATAYPAEPAYCRGLASSHAELGTLLPDLARRPEAEEHYQTALTIQQKLAADFPAAPQYRQELAGMHYNLAWLLASLGRAEAEEQYRQALRIQERLASDFRAIPAYREALANTHNGLAILFSALRRPSEARDHFLKALDLQKTLATEFRGRPKYLSELASSHNNLGTVLDGQGKWHDAEVEYRQALDIRQKLATQFRRVPLYQKKLAVSHNNLGSLLTRLGRHAEAQEQCRKAVAIREELATGQPEVAGYQVDLGVDYFNFGVLLRASGQPDASLEWFEKAIRTLTAVYEQDRRLVLARTNLLGSYAERARAYDRLQKYDEAVQDWNRALELCTPQEQPIYRAARASAWVNAGQVAEAVAEVAELVKKSGWPAGAWYDFACVYALASGKSEDRKQEYADRAMELLQRAVKAGYNNAVHMKKDTDLDTLRGREDFKGLIAELEKKSTAGQEKMP
jgi:serine/threonine protein kinase/tetratricopeptide (TPR) repeat protein